MLSSAARPSYGALLRSTCGVHISKSLRKPLFEAASSFNNASYTPHTSPLSSSRDASLSMSYATSTHASHSTLVAAQLTTPSLSIRSDITEQQLKRYLTTSSSSSSSSYSSSRNSAERSKSSLSRATQPHPCESAMKPCTLRTWVRSIFTRLLRSEVSTTSTNTASEGSSSPCSPDTPSMSRAQAIRDVLSQNMNCKVLDVQDVSGGCGAFFKLLVVSEQFAGKRSVSRHREVQTLLKSYIKDMHGIALTTLTPEEYAPLQNEAASNDSAAR